MDKRQREQLKDKIDEISMGFSSLVEKIDEMPDRDFQNVSREIDQFRFKYAKVLNLSPDGQGADREATPGYKGLYNLGEDSGTVSRKPTF